MRQKSAIVVKHGYRWSARLVVLSLVVGGILLGLARLFLPTVVEYRPDIESLAEEVFQAPVNIGQIETGWHGLYPIVTLVDVDISRLSDISDKIHLKSLDIVISPLASLLAWELRPSQVMLKMHELDVKRLEDGTFDFTLGYENQQEQDLLGKDMMNWLLEQPDLHIQVERADVEDRMAVWPSLEFNDIEIIFQKDAADVTVSVDTSVTNLAGNVLVIARLKDIASSNDLPSMQTYIQLADVNLDAIRGIAGGKYGLPDSGHVDLELWSDIKQGKPDKIHGNWLSRDIYYSANKMGHEFSLDNLKTGFIWERKPQGWKLELADFQMDRLGHQWPKTTLSVDLELQGKSRNYLINTNFLYLDDVLPIIWRQPAISEDIRDQLVKLSPRGQLSNLKTQLSYEDGAIRQYGVQMDISDLSFNALGDIPGVKGVDAYLAATEKAGLFRIGTLDAEIYLPTLFRKPFPLDRVKGSVSWSRLEDGLLIESADLAAENAHLKTQSRLSIHFPDSGTPFVDLQTNFHDGDGTHTSLYLPAYVLDKEALEWLDKGIVAGHVEYGSFVLYGALNDFPYDDKNGKFEVRFKVIDGILDYYENWPVIDEIEAEVLFSGRGMHIEATSGKIFEADIGSAIVEIADLDADNPLLTVNGRVRSSSEDLMRYLTDTKLAGDYQTALSFMSLKGAHDLKLNLNIPLSSGDVKFDGNLSFPGNELEIPSWQVSLKAIEGQLDFTEEKFVAKNIKADFEGHSASVDVSTHQTLRGRETHINASSHADISKLLTQGSKSLSGLIEGTSPVRVDIVVPDYPEGESYLEASSTLVGTSINLPPPLGKHKDAELLLTVNTGFEGEAARRIGIEIGDDTKAALSISEKEASLDGVALYFGDISQDELFSHASGQAYIGGKLSSLPMGEWANWYRALPNYEASVNAFPVSTDIIVDQFYFTKWYIKDVGIKTRQTSESWLIDLSGPGAQGQISVPLNRSSRVDGRLSRLSLYKEEIEAEEADSHEQATGLMPGDIPSIRLDIEQLQYQSRDLGSLHAEIMSQDHSLKVEKVSLKNPQTVTSVTGDWLYDPAGNTHKTKLKLTQESKDFGDFLTRHGFADTVKGGKAKVKASFVADAPLPDISSKHLNGSARFDLDKGEIVEIDPGGAGRVFGLLSFQTLPRRLLLDFTDLFSKGMSFDEIDGNFTFSDGQAYTNNLIMEAPSSRVEISGRVGLAEEDYDQSVKVIPKVSSTLPVAGALAGGPGLAVVMYLTHKFFKDPINKMTEIEYQVTGPWREPVVTRLEKKEKQVASQAGQDQSTTGEASPDSL